MIALLYRYIYRTETPAIGFSYHKNSAFLSTTPIKNSIFGACRGETGTSKPTEARMKNLWFKRVASNNHLGAAVLTAGALMATGTAMADTGATEQVWRVEMKGKPPYKRTLVDAPSVGAAARDSQVVDVAAMEIYDAEVNTGTVWNRDYRGRPPFARKREELPLIDAASMELVDQDAPKTVFRGRPPFKRHK